MKVSPSKASLDAFLAKAQCQKCKASKTSFHILSSKPEIKEPAVYGAD